MNNESNTAQPEKKFEAFLRFKQINRAKIIIQARTLDEARERAWEIEPDEVDDWNPVEGDIWVDGVEPLEREQQKQ